MSRWHVGTLEGSNTHGGAKCLARTCDRQDSLLFRHEGHSTLALPCWNLFQRSNTPATLHDLF